MCTRDGGKSWERQETDITNGVTQLSTADGTNCYAVGRDGVILKTADGGETWTNQSSGCTQTIGAVGVIHTDHVFILLLYTRGALKHPGFVEFDIEGGRGFLFHLHVIFLALLGVPILALADTGAGFVRVVALLLKGAQEAVIFHGRAPVFGISVLPTY